MKIVKGTPNEVLNDVVKSNKNVKRKNKQEFMIFWIIGFVIIYSIIVGQGIIKTIANVLIVIVFYLIFLGVKKVYKRIIKKSQEEWIEINKKIKKE